MVPIYTMDILIWSRDIHRRYKWIFKRPVFTDLNLLN